MYSGPSPRNLVLSVLVHGAAIAALFHVPNPSLEPDAHLENGRPTEIRISGKLYYVAQLDGSLSGSSGSPLPSKQAAQKKQIASRRTQWRDCRSTRRFRGTFTETAACGANSRTQPGACRLRPACRNRRRLQRQPRIRHPRPLPRKIRPVRQEARTFIPPEVHPNRRSRPQSSDPAAVAAELDASQHSAAELPRVYGSEADAQDSEAVPKSGAQDSADAYATLDIATPAAGTWCSSRPRRWEIRSRFCR